ncbi:MAG TPA: c-type cytochrome [Verrucomicrobiae bacterium]|jgi:putative heme-binding domain-containing protein|nr:c-type cytochrome [Verrucomicrobiae bacterium]
MPLSLRRALFFLVCAVATSTLMAQDHAAAASATPAKPAIVTEDSENFDELEQGRRLFERNCASCHGLNGEGAKGPTLAQPSLPRASNYESLLRIITGGINGTEMPSAHLERKDIELVAKYVKSLSLRPHLHLAIPGDAVRGEQIYAKKGGCAQCHMLHGQGGFFGPDLSDVGSRRSPEYLRRSLVDPSADVPQSYTPWRSEISLPENFLYVRLVTRDGQELAGVRVNEDTFSIQIRQANGSIRSFFKSELAELHKDFGKSPMPSYATALATNELDDLVAFLSSLHLEK